jgi:hypothetical protein
MAAVLLAAGVAFASSGGGTPAASVRSAPARSSAMQSSSSTAPGGSSSGMGNGGSAACQKISAQLMKTDQNVENDLTNNSANPVAAVPGLQQAASGYRQAAQAASGHPQLQRALDNLASTVSALAQEISSGNASAAVRSETALQGDVPIVVSALQSAC